MGPRSLSDGGISHHRDRKRLGKLLFSTRVAFR